MAWRSATKVDWSKIKILGAVEVEEGVRRPTNFLREDRELRQMMVDPGGPIGARPGRGNDASPSLVLRHERLEREWLDADPNMSEGHPIRGKLPRDPVFEPVCSTSMKWAESTAPGTSSLGGKGRESRTKYLFAQQTETPIRGVRREISRPTPVQRDPCE